MQGTNAYGVIKAAESLGFSAKGVKGNKVETSIDDTKLYNKTGEKLDLKIGMYCETKIILEQKSILRFLLEKINLMD